MGESWRWLRIWRWRRADGGNQVAVKESWRRWWRVGGGGELVMVDGGGHIFHFHFHFHFHFPAKKSVQKGEVGSDPRAGYFF